MYFAASKPMANHIVNALDRGVHASTAHRLRLIIKYFRSTYFRTYSLEIEIYVN